VLATAYPRAIAGAPVDFGYDKSTLELTVDWNDKAGVTGSTDIYLPPGDFPDGADVQLNGDYTEKWNAKRHILSLTVKATPGVTHHLVITPTAPDSGQSSIG
jgi:endoglycosylceramidase